MDDNTQQVTSKTPTTSPQKEPKKVALAKPLPRKQNRLAKNRKKLK